MTHPSELLELIHTSPDRWRVIRLEGHEWRHTERALEAFRASHESRLDGVSVDREADEPEETDEAWRLWFEKPDRIRTEFPVGSNLVTAVIAGETWWSWSSSRGGSTNAGWPNSEHGIGPGERLLDLAPLLPFVTLEPLGETTFLERSALHVRATGRPIDDPYVEVRIGIHGFASGADEYDIVLDAQRGIGLRVELRRSGQPFLVTEATGVVFDEDLPEETFRPPGDGRVEYAIVPHTREIPLEEAAQQVPFSVLVPEHPPVGPANATLHFGPPMPQLFLRYVTPPPRRGDNRSLVVWEAAEPLPEVPRWLWREADGVRFLEDDTTQPSTLRVRLQLGSTYIDISSTDLPMEDLIVMARSLVPLPGGPPRLRAFS